MGFYHASPVEFESVSNVTATNSVDLGTVRVHNSEEYVYVYNAGNSQATIGAGVIASGTSGYSITVSSVTGFGACMGFVKHTTLTTGTYGWLLTKGAVYTAATPANSGITAGAPVVLGANGIVTEQTGALTAVACGYVVAATGSAGVAGLFVRCFGS